MSASATELSERAVQIADPRPRSMAARAAWPGGFAAAGLVLFYCYLRLSQTVPVNSDGAGNALQAWDMLHGNLLLRGWLLSDVSFYTTELPQYLLIEDLRGLDTGVVHIAGAMTYTLVVLLAALLAKGRATGRAGVIRALLAVGLMLAPQLGTGTYLLLLSPDHIGTAAPILAAWLILDLAPPRWYVPAAVGLLLAWAQVGDPLVTYAAAAPLVVVCGVRAYRGVVQQRHSLASRWFDLSLGAAAAVSVEAAAAAVRLVAAHGGYFVAPLNMAFVPVGIMPQQIWSTVQSALVLFGADFFGRQLGVGTLLALLHLAGAGLAVWAVARGARRFFRDGDLVAQVLVAGILTTLAAFMFADVIKGVTAAHEIAVVLPFGAVLAGRLLAGLLTRARLVPVLAVLAACYCLALAHDVTQPPQPAANASLTAWLTAHHLRYGLGGYWQANSTTLDSAGRMRVAPVITTGRQQLKADNWEVKSSWYDPRLYDANFVVTVKPPTLGWWYALPTLARDTFGRPAHTYSFGGYTVQVWDTNLLRRLRAPVGGPR